MIDATREKKEYSTKSGAHKFEAVTYITALDQRYIEEPLYDSMEMKAKPSGEQEATAVKGSVIRTMQDRRFEVTIVSLDGDTSDLVNRCLGLPLDEYNDIKDVVAEITGEKKALASLEQKKNT